MGVVFCNKGLTEREGEQGREREGEGEGEEDWGELVVGGRTRTEKEEVLFQD